MTANLYYLTPQENEAYTFINDFYQENNYPPNYQQIADSIGLKSKSNITAIVRVLVDAGLLVRIPGRRVIPSGLNNGK